jgi:hypothetical protein
MLEGRTLKSVRFRHHDADRWATLTIADDRTPASLTYDDHDPAHRLPYKLRRLIDGRPIREERLSRVTLNEPVSDEKFYELIQKNGLSVEMIACGHGNASLFLSLPMCSGARRS